MMFNNACIIESLSCLSPDSKPSVFKTDIKFGLNTKQYSAPLMTCPPFVSSYPSKPPSSTTLSQHQTFVRTSTSDATRFEYSSDCLRVDKSPERQKMKVTYCSARLPHCLKQFKKKTTKNSTHPWLPLVTLAVEAAVFRGFRRCGVTTFAICLAVSVFCLPGLGRSETYRVCS